MHNVGFFIRPRLNDSLDRSTYHERIKDPVLRALSSLLNLAQSAVSQCPHCNPSVKKPPKVPGRQIKLPTLVRSSAPGGARAGCQKKLVPESAVFPTAAAC
jgi:hypothetical protein